MRGGKSGSDMQMPVWQMAVRRALTLLTLLAISAAAFGCSSEETSNLQRGPELVTPPKVQPQPQITVTGTATPQSARNQRAKQFVDTGKLEMQIEAYEAAVSAFEAALQLDPSNQEAPRALEEARKAAAQSSTSAATPVRGGISLPTSPLPILPTLGPLPTSTPTPSGCAEDEKLTVEPSPAAVGDQVLLSLTSRREHQNIRLASPAPTESLGGVFRDSGFLWQWRYQAKTAGEFNFYFYVDHNTLCASEALTVTGRWEPLSTGLPLPQDFTITALAVSPAYPFDSTLFLAFDGAGVYKTVDANAASPTFLKTFSPIELQDLKVTALALSPAYGADTTVFIGTSLGRIYRSMDGGGTWVLQGALAGGGKPITSLTVSPNFATDRTVLAGVEGAGVYASADSGGTWGTLNDGLTDQYVQALAISADYANDNVLFTGGKFSGSYSLGAPTPVASPTGTPTPGPTPVPTVRSSKWVPINKGLEDLWIRALAISPYYSNDRTLYAGSAYGGLFKYDGTQWTRVNTGLAERWDWVHTVGVSPRYPQEPRVYVGTRTGVYRTTNGGGSWVTMRVGLPNLSASPDINRGVRALAISPDFGNDRTVFAAVWRDNIYRVRD